MDRHLAFVTRCRPARKRIRPPTSARRQHGTCATFLDAGRSRPPRRGWSRFARNLWERHPHGRSLDEPVSVVIP